MVRLLKMNTIMSEMKNILHWINRSRFAEERISVFKT